MTIWDDVASRVKAGEATTKQRLPENGYAILRLDGRHFHTYTKHLRRPYDEQFMNDMDTVASRVCKEVSGVLMGYVQSDEITVVFGDLATENTQMWFGGVVQKIVSVTAGLASATMSRLRPDQPVAMFDARVWGAGRQGVVEALAWRREDAVRNSILMTAQSVVPHRELQHVGVRGAYEKALLAGVDWAAQPAGFKFGRVLTPEVRLEEVSYVHKRTGVTETTEALRTRWNVRPAVERFAVVADTSGGKQLNATPFLNDILDGKRRQA